jgi:aldehyde dehydrogenase (NAD+)
MTATVEHSDLLSAELLIGGRFRQKSTGGEFEHINPSTGLPQASVPMAGVADVDEAVAAAREAFGTWRKWDPVERRRALTRLADLMRSHADELHTVQALESGIPISMAGVLVENSLNWTDYAASAADKLSGEVVPSTPGEIFDYTLVEPVGVVGVIIPWNGPVGSLGMCALPPLAAGCCVIIKPSELAPFSASLFGKLCQEAGLPPGVVSVLPGGAEAGQALVGHPGVDMISFTGGTATSRTIATKCAEMGKRCVLELGGKSADLVFSDADVTKAAQEALGWLLVTNGQACTLASRFIVHTDIYDQYVETLTGLMQGLKVGDAIDPNTGMGPVINARAVERILGMVDRAQQQGATLLTGGTRLDLPGYMIAPTLFGDVDNSSELAQDEVFGPVLSALRFEYEDQAVEMANASQYGLAGYIHTSDLSRALRVAAALETGNVGINGGVAPAAANAPFGGVKQSGLGRLGGIAGILEYTTVKNVQIRL